METKIELEVVTNQLQAALNELKRKRLDRNLIHDYITEALSRVKKLNEPAVSKSEDVEREALLLAYAKLRDDIVVHRRLKPEELVKEFLSKQ